MHQETIVGDKNITGRPIESAKPGPFCLSEIEPPTKEYIWAGPRHPRTHVADVQLGLHVGPKQFQHGANSEKILCNKKTRAMKPYEDKAKF